MFHFIYAIGSSEGISLTPKQIKKVAKQIFNSGTELSEDAVRAKIKEITA